MFSIYAESRVPSLVQLATKKILSQNTDPNLTVSCDYNPFSAVFDDTAEQNLAFEIVESDTTLNKALHPIFGGASEKYMQMVISSMCEILRAGKPHEKGQVFANLIKSSQNEHLAKEVRKKLTHLVVLLNDEKAFIGLCLSAQDLSGLDLSNLNLSRSHFGNTNLSQTRMVNTDLRKVKMFSVNMTSATLLDANFFSATLSKVVLNDADLRGVNLQHANVFNSKLRWALLCGAKCGSTKFSGTDLSNSNMCEITKNDETIFSHCIVTGIQNSTISNEEQKQELRQNTIEKRHCIVS